MKPDHKTFVFCVVCFCSARCDAQTCPGWFGPTCKYQCRCTGGQCSSDGQCTLSAKCENGWFGPACQYADLAYKTPNAPEIIDSNENTCLSGNNTHITIVLNETLSFTWLRVTVTHQGSAFLKDLSLSFLSTSSPVACNDTKKEFVNSTTLDIHCTLHGLTNMVKLDGKAIGYLCSVFINGGRNVAVKETATQDSTYVSAWGPASADKAVDGDTKQSFSDLTCTHTSTAINLLPVWSLTLSKLRSINRFVIYNRNDDAPERLQGFKLKYFDNTSQHERVIEDTDPVREKYTLHLRPAITQNISMTVNGTERILTLCEFEAYGDTVCDGQHYGFECEQECQCPFGMACFVATGGCPSVCPAGFQGDNCSIPCDAGTFGVFCWSKCSPNCREAKSSNMSKCDRVTGACVRGCKAGYLGTYCDEQCEVERYGDNCSLTCSPKCVAEPNATETSCSHERGFCIKGCKTGVGVNCNSTCSPSCVPTGGSQKALCNSSTGACFKGCSPGFTSETCDKSCDAGTFGINCSKSCSKNCATGKDPLKSACSHITGVCTEGCRSDYTGKTCDTAVAESTGYILEGIIAVCLLVALALFAGFCLTSRGRKASLGEGGATNVNPGSTPAQK